MDTSKRSLEGAGPSGPPLKRLNESGGLEDEPVDEQLDAVPENLEDDAEDVDERLLEEELELHLGEAGRNWKRPAPPPLNSATQSLGVRPTLQCLRMFWSFSKEVFKDLHRVRNNMSRNRFNAVQ